MKRRSPKTRPMSASTRPIDFDGRQVGGPGGLAEEDQRAHEEHEASSADDIIRT